MASIVDTSGLPKPAADDSAINNVLNLVFGIVGLISLLVITIGGFRYVTSHGDANQVAQAKNTILYALVGLVVTIVAFSIVTFVIGNV